MDTGVPSATTPGTLMTQEWCADSWDIPVILFFTFNTCLVYVAVPGRN